jgi:hypothetical protein
MVLTAYFVLSPVTGLSCHRHWRIKAHHDPVGQIAPPQDLTPASGRQDHTTSPSAANIFRQHARDRSRENPPCDHIARLNAAASTASHPYVRDDRDTPLCVGRDGGGYRSDLGQERTGIFLRKGLDTGCAEQPVGQIIGAGSQREASVFPCKGGIRGGPAFSYSAADDVKDASGTSSA